MVLCPIDFQRVDYMLALPKPAGFLCAELWLLHDGQ